MAITSVLTLSVVSAPQQANAIFMVENLELSVGDNMLVSENDFIVFEVNEEKEKTDLNNDEDFEDTVLHVYDITTGILTNLGLSGNIKMYDERNSMLDGNLLAFVVSEHAQGNTDLNGDGNAFYGRGAGDISLHVYDHSTGVTTNLQQGGDIRAVHGNLVAFTVSEYHQGEDLNGDGLFDTSVLHVYDHSKGTTTNVGLESNVLAFDGNLIAFAVNERDQGNTALNGDGDTRDRILHVYDHSAKETVNLEIGGFPTLDGNLIAFASDEFSQGNIDLNGDGDTNDSVLHVMELIEDKVIEDELFCGKDVSEFDSVMEGTDNDDLLQGTKNNDLILGMNGDDLIYSSNGNDCVYGGNGNDFIFGRGGNDIIFGDDGDDTLFGAMGDDILNGGLGNDHLIDDNGDDRLDGGDDNDLCFDKYGNNSFESCEVKSE